MNFFRYIDAPDASKCADQSTGHNCVSAVQESAQQP
jgi:hypothetical protein